MARCPDRTDHGYRRHRRPLSQRERRAHVWSIRHVSRRRGQSRTRPQRAYPREVAHERAPLSLRRGEALRERRQLDRPRLHEEGLRYVGLSAIAMVQWACGEALKKLAASVADIYRIAVNELARARIVPENLQNIRKRGYLGRRVVRSAPVIADRNVCDVEVVLLRGTALLRGAMARC